MTFKKHDFVEVEYTGRLQDNTVFDTTDATIAKQAGITRDASKFGAVAICLGESHILKGIEEKIMEHGLGQFNLSLTPENAFGKKNVKLLKLIPMKVFRKENINPFTGLEVNIDNTYGIVRSVSGGRVIVDFNHPLSGRDVKYEVKVNRLVDNPLEKARSIFKNELNIHDIKLEYESGKLVIEETIPEQVFEALKKRIMELAPEIKEIDLKKPAEKKEEKQHSE
jgi:FKBP-type peptidyl-prolyl cis-trans isomerase SlyD